MGTPVGPGVTHRRRRSPRLPVGQGFGFCGLFPPPYLSLPLWAPPPVASRAKAHARRAGRTRSPDTLTEVRSLSLASQNGASAELPVVLVYQKDPAAQPHV